MRQFQEYDAQKDRLLPLAKTIVPLALASLGIIYREAHKKEDYQEATDLIANDLPRISIRSSMGWGNNIMLRIGPNDGFKYEYQKIMDGCGDLYFYGFHSKESLNYHKWYLIDLNVFRRVIEKEGADAFGFASNKCESNKLCEKPFRIFYLDNFKEYKGLSVYPGLILDTKEAFESRIAEQINICSSGLKPAEAKAVL
jgi:hypothetical protein